MLLLITGGTVNVWCGAGDGTVHSRRWPTATGRAPAFCQEPETAEIHAETRHIRGRLRDAVGHADERAVAAEHHHQIPRRVGLVAKTGLTAAAGVLAELAGWLEARDVHAVFETETASVAGLPPGRRTVSRDELPHACDLIVVLGGDGTLIGMADRIAERRPTCRSSA